MVVVGVSEDENQITALLAGRKTEECSSAWNINVKLSEGTAIRMIYEVQQELNRERKEPVSA